MAHNREEPGRRWLRDAAYIGGQWRRTPETFAVQDPATGEVLAEVPDLGRDGIEEAIQAASAAAAGWRATTADARADLLRALFDRMVQEQEPLAELLTLENGKPLAEARGEIAYGASFVRWFSEEARRVYGEQIPASQADRRLLVSKEPVGVCALIAPWNFPNAMITRKLAPALAAGCTTVIKPASQTPLSTLAIAALCEEVGIPPGVVNVVTAQDAGMAGEVLCGSAAVHKLSFTGSTAVGRKLMAQCAPTLKRLSMELGGNAPFIVFEDADLDAAVEGAMASKYRNNGQSCVASDRFLVQASVAEAFVERVAARSRALKQGHGLDAGVEVGPLISRSGWEKVDRLVADAIQKGAEVRCGGRPRGKRAEERRFWPPTVLSGVTGEMEVWEEEVFGPVISVRTFVEEEEGIRLANDTPFGLAAYAYTQNLARSWRVRESLAAGMVGINTGMISTAQAPFGGVGQSGFGREGSRHGIEEYLQYKYVCVGI